MMVISDQRMSLAIQQIESGSGFAIGELFLIKDRFSKDTLTIIFASSWQNENMTEERFMLDLFECKRITVVNRSDYPMLDDYLKNKSLNYKIVYDYGTGGIDIGNEINGVVSYTYKNN